MAPEAAAPMLESVKARIFADHERMRGLLAEIENAANVEDSDDEGTAPSALIDAIWRLFLFFDDHLAYEERNLVPILEKAHIWGTTQVERLHKEHHDQRTVLLA